MSRQRVTVLMGGPSAEHEISLRSGQGVAAALSRRGFRVRPVVIPRNGTADQAQAFAAEALAAQPPDVVFIALHGTFGEDGTVQQLCEDRHVAYVGSDAAASRLGMDKVASRERFQRAGLHVPRSRIVSAPAEDPRDLSDLSYPLMVKPADQGSSVGISRVEDPAGLPAALREAGRYSRVVLVEEFLAGRELTVSVLGEAALPVVEIRPKHGFFDFAAKYTPGLTEYDVPATLPADAAQAVQAAGRAAHEALGCRHLSRTDVILEPRRGPVILEVNTIPGFTPTSLLPKAAACAGIPYDELCERLVLLAAQDAAQLARAHG
jgi:D-alanine--D-alanine ligase